MKKYNYILIFLFTIANNSFSQIGKEVNMNDLAKKSDGMFYLYQNSKFTLYTGTAYRLYPNGNKWSVWEIKNGISIRFLMYSNSGKIIQEENFNLKKQYSGKYFSGNEKGDTLNLGVYKKGIKEGKWIIINPDSTKSIIYYKKGVPIIK